MSDENTSTEDTSETSLRTSEAPEWARSAITKANNEAAKYRTDLRAKTDEHTAALAKIEELTGEKTAATQRIADAEKELLKFKTTVSVNVPGDQAEQFSALLQGNNAEELKAHADQLLAMFGPQTKKAPGTDPSQGMGQGEQNMSEGAAFLMNALGGAIHR